MGKLLKNPDLSPGSLAARLPIANSALGDTPVNGLIRFNTTNSKVEFYYNGTWSQVAKIGTVSIVVDDFTTADAVFGSNKQTYTMAQAESDPTAIAVFIGGVYQQPTTNYTVTGSTIMFTSPPPDPGVNPNRITIIHNLNSTNAV
jgi:hypothetical protein